MFEEPGNYFKVDVGKEVVHTRPNGETIALHCAPKHSLWGHELWNSSVFLADAFDTGDLPVKDMSVLELGAGAGLPSFVAAMNGASVVVVTDYATKADDTLTGALRQNLAALRAVGKLPRSSCCHVEGHVWGQDASPLLAHLSSLSSQAAANAPAAPAAPTTAPLAEGPGSLRFDRIVLADLLFNRQSHRQLLTSCADCLAPGGVVWCAFAHHDPQKAPLDMAFFALAPEYGFTHELVRETQFERDIFQHGDGMDDERRTVHFYELRRAVQTS